MTNTKETTGWEERFKYFETELLYVGWYGTDDLKAFISKEITNARESLIEEIENIKPVDEKNRTIGYLLGYRQAKYDILKSLNQK